MKTSILLVLLCQLGPFGAWYAATNYGPWVIAGLCALIFAVWFVTRWMRVVATYDARVARLISEIKP